MTQNREFLIAGDPEALRLWPDWPLYAMDYDALLAQAKSSLEVRERIYPSWIQRGDIADDEAARDIEGWRQLVAEWTWIVEGTGELPPRHTLRQRLASVDLSLERVDVEIRRRGGHEVLRQSHLLQALRWHLQRLDDGEPAVHRLTRLSRALQAQAAAGQAMRQGVAA